MRLHVYSLVFFFLLFHYKLVYTRIQSRILYVCYYYHVYCYYDRAISKWIFVPICIYSIIKSDDWRRRNMIQAFLLNSIWVTLARETMCGTNWIEHTDYIYTYRRKTFVFHIGMFGVYHAAYPCIACVYRRPLANAAATRSLPLSFWLNNWLSQMSWSLCSAGWWARACASQLMFVCAPWRAGEVMQNCTLGRKETCSTLYALLIYGLFGRTDSIAAPFPLVCAIR